MDNNANNYMPRIICSVLFVFITMDAHGSAIVKSDPETWLEEAEADFDPKNPEYGF